MAEAKVILTVLVPGTTMLSEEEAAKVPNGKGYLYSKVILEDNKKRRETIVVNVRKCKPIKQIIKLSADAYNYMTSPSECPEGFQAFNWKKLTPEQRLYFHLSRLSESMGGFSFHYDIIKD